MSAGRSALSSGGGGRAHGAPSTSAPAVAEEFSVTKMQEHQPQRNIILFKMTDECGAALREAKRAGIRMQFHHTPQGSHFEIGAKRFDCSVQQKRDGFNSMDALCRRGGDYQRVGSISSKFQVKATANSYAKTGEKAKQLLEDQRKTQEMPERGGSGKKVAAGPGGGARVAIGKPKAAKAVPTRVPTLPRRPGLSIRPSNAIVPGAAAAAAAAAAQAKASPLPVNKSPKHLPIVPASSSSSSTNQRGSIQPIQFQLQQSQSKLATTLTTPIAANSPKQPPTSAIKNPIQFGPASQPSQPPAAVPTPTDSFPTRINFKRRIQHNLNQGGGSSLPATPSQSKRPREGEGTVATASTLISSSGSKSAIGSDNVSANESLSEGSGSSYGSPDKGDAIKIVDSGEEASPQKAQNGVTHRRGPAAAVNAASPVNVNGFNNYEEAPAESTDWYSVYLPIADWDAYQTYANNYAAAYKEYRALYDQLTEISNKLKALKKQREEGYTRQLAESIEAMCKRLQSTEYRSMRAEHAKLREKVSALKQRMIDWERAVQE